MGTGMSWRGAGHRAGETPPRGILVAGSKQSRAACWARAERAGPALTAGRGPPAPRAGLGEALTAGPAGPALGAAGHLRALTAGRTWAGTGRHLGLELDELGAPDQRLGEAGPAHAPVEVLLQLEEHEAELRRRPR